jgi:hypothetical protein
MPCKRKVATWADGLYSYPARVNLMSEDSSEEIGNEWTPAWSEGF